MTIDMHAVLATKASPAGRVQKRVVNHGTTPFWPSQALF